MLGVSQGLPRFLRKIIMGPLAFDDYQEFLRQTIDTYWHHPTTNAINELWVNLQEGYKLACDERREQLLIMSEIIDTWPKHVKKATDPWQHPCWNTQHISMTFCTFRRLLMEKPNRRCHLFAHHFFPLVPFDRYLRLFVETLRNRPLDMTERTADNIASGVWQEFESLKLHHGADINDRVGTTSYHQDITEDTPYPPPIIADIKIAIAGMAYIYTMPSTFTPTISSLAPKILRTKSTPWSAPPFRQPFAANPSTSSIPDDNDPESQDLEPVFMSPWLTHFEETSITRTELSSIHYYHQKRFSFIRENAPHYRKEIEWLRAFLRAVTFMEGLES